MGAPVVEWPRMPHPSIVGSDRAIEHLKAVIETHGGADSILGIFVEPFQERTGYALDESFWESLDTIRQETGIPLVSIETASAAYRCQAQPFATDMSRVIPDIRAWWPGGQTGFIHLNDKYFVEKPLTMVSTWDGDEILIRCHHNLRALRLGAHDHAYGIFEPVDAVRGLGYLPYVALVYMRLSTWVLMSMRPSINSPVRTSSARVSERNDGAHPALLI